MTKTATYTGTFTRAEYIALQADMLIFKTMNVDFGDRSLKGIIENQWIETIAVVALDKDERKQMELTMRIDWESHRVHIESGRVAIPAVGAHAKDEQFNVVLAKMAKKFVEVAKMRSWKVTWTVGYRADLDINLVHRHLNTAPVKREWADGVLSAIWAEEDCKADEVTYVWVASVSEDVSNKFPKRFRGVISFFRGNYGFITPRQGQELPLDWDEDIHVHLSQVDATGYTKLENGTEVEFEVREVMRRGQPLLEALAVRQIK
jgi:cold shock CspA family protein